MDRKRSWSGEGRGAKESEGGKAICEWRRGDSADDETRTCAECVRVTSVSSPGQRDVRVHVA